MFFKKKEPPKEVLPVNQFELTISYSDGTQEILGYVDRPKLPGDGAISFTVTNLESTPRSWHNLRHIKSLHIIENDNWEGKE